MTAISASLVKELRDQTGAGMMDCKRALEEAGGDIEAAVRILRERGAAQAAKRSGRGTPEGLVLARIENGMGTLAAVGCETEPVSKNEEFRSFAERVLDTASEGGDVESLEEGRQELVGKIGENIAVVGTARFEAVDGATIESYVHPPANKLGVLVQVAAALPTSRARSRCTSRRPGHAGSAERTFPRTSSLPNGRSTRTRTSCRASPSRRVRRSWRGC